MRTVGGFISNISLSLHSSLSANLKQPLATTPGKQALESQLYHTKGQNEKPRCQPESIFLKL